LGLSRARVAARARRRPDRPVRCEPRGPRRAEYSV